MSKYKTIQSDKDEIDDKVQDKLNKRLDLK